MKRVLSFADRGRKCEIIAEENIKRHRKAGAEHDNDNWSYEIVRASWLASGAYGFPGYAKRCFCSVAN
jgi:hypothetical protein